MFHFIASIGFLTISLFIIFFKRCCCRSNNVHSQLIKVNILPPRASHFSPDTSCFLSTLPFLMSLWYFPGFTSCFTNVTTVWLHLYIHSFVLLSYILLLQILYTLTYSVFFLTVIYVNYEKKSWAFMFIHLFIIPGILFPFCKSYSISCVIGDKILSNFNWKRLFHPYFFF